MRRFTLALTFESFVRAVKENLTELKAVQQKGEACTTLEYPAAHARLLSIAQHDPLHRRSKNLPAR